MILLIFKYFWKVTLDIAEAAGKTLSSLQFREVCRHDEYI